jgi:hypothetical protein
MSSRKKEPESKKHFKTIEVKWADHWVNPGDHSLKDVIEDAKPMYGNYTGYLVHENKQVIILCSNYWDEEEDGDVVVSDPMYIMKRTIVYRSDRDAKKA